MSRFEMVVAAPEKVQFELRVVLTLAEWREVSQALTPQNAHGPAYALTSAIREMTTKANVDYRAWPDDAQSPRGDGDREGM